MIWWQNTIMHLSCKCAWWAYCSTFSTYVLLQADSACKNVHKLVHDVVPQKDTFCREHMFFWLMPHFLNSLSAIHFFWLVWPSMSVCPSSVIQQTHSMWNLFVHLSVLCTHVNYHDWLHNHMSDRVHDCTNNLFSQSRVWTPDLAAQSFCEDRVWAPALAVQSFCGSRVQFPGPDCLFLGLLYPWPTSLTPTNAATSSTAGQKLLLEEKNLSAWLVALAVWGSWKASTCVTKA